MWGYEAGNTTIVAFMNSPHKCLLSEVFLFVCVRTCRNKYQCVRFVVRNET